MKIVKSEEILRTKVFWVTQDKAVDPDGFEIDRAIIQHAGSAVVMPVDAKGRILLVRQYRLPAKAKMWELTAGRLDPGEKPLQAAKRELAEETGYKAKKWKKIIEYYPSPGFLAEKMTVFLATDLTEGKQQPMDDERIETRWFSQKELDKMIRDGKINDGKTLAGYSVWKRFFK